MDEKDKMIKLNNILEEMGSVAIGFSGGVDSTFLLKASIDAINGNVLAVTASSSTFPQRELSEAADFAKSLGAEHIVITPEILSMEEFTKNSSNRCYYCKKEIFSKIIAIANQKGYKNIIDGTNIDDLGDYRPGMEAAKELGVRSPLIEAGITKSDIRILSKEMGLPTWNKPSFACLSSRIPYGQQITEQKLEMIELSEQYLLDLGFEQVRVRHRGEVALIEVSPEERIKFFNLKLMDEIVKRLKEIGFLYVALDIQGYRTGSMNEVLKKE